MSINRNLRRTFFHVAIVSLWVGACLFSITLLAHAAENDPSDAPVQLLPDRKVDSIDHVEVTLDVGGYLKAKRDGEIDRSKMSVVARFQYDERTLAFGADDSTPARSIRFYQDASAVIKLDDGGFKPKLRPDRRLVVNEIQDSHVTLFSPRGRLDRTELELIDILGNSLVLERLLPTEPVAPGDSWTFSSDMMVALLGLDAVGKTDVQGTLVSINESIASVKFAGKVSGADDGISTEVELTAKYQFDRSRGRISWFAMLLKENRSIGHVAHGLDVTAKVEMTIAPIEADSDSSLSDSVLADLSLEPTPQLTELEYNSTAGGWRIAYDRRWNITQDGDKTAELRLLDRGDVLAQCKVVTTPLSGGGDELTLAGFQRELQKSLGEAFGQFVAAAQRENEAGYREFRVVVQGEVKELPIRWIYYVLSDRQGRQVVLAFLLENDLTERFGQADRQFIANVRLVGPDVPVVGQSHDRPTR